MDGEPSASGGRRVGVIVPAAGSGTRLGSDRPKAFVELAGRTILTRCIESIITSGVATTIVVAAPDAYLDAARAEMTALESRLSADAAHSIPGLPRISVVAGGSNRIESVRLASDRITECEYVLVHDAARCLTPPEVFTRVVSALESGAEVVVPVLPMTDTVRAITVESTASRSASMTELLGASLDRSTLRRIQTPQGFTSAVLAHAHDDYARRSTTPGVSDLDATDDAGLAERIGVPVQAVPGAEEALKITHPLDMVLGEYLACRSDVEHTESRPRP